MDEEKKDQQVVVNTSTFVGSTYSQVSRVTITDNEITIEFAYIHPADRTQGQTVARVTMPKEAGKELASTILSVDKIHTKRKEGKQND